MEYNEFSISAFLVDSRSSGEAVRAFLYITDAVVGMFTVLFHGEPAMAYNLANESEPICIKDLAHMLAKSRADKKIQVVVTDGGQKGYCDYRRTALDTSAIEQIGWRPHISLKEGVNRVLHSRQATDSSETKKLIETQNLTYDSMYS